ncbi:MAG: hypothetical protein HY661_07650 [Betaproteobacteria bacterium]|nr:hypothetical protein [Betaproteobacteria bacterium]
MIPTLQLGALGRAGRVAAGGGGGGGGPPETNLVLWLDADDADSFTLDGDLVDQWNDKSASANHAVPATVGAVDRRPTKTGSSVVFSTAGNAKGLVCASLFIGATSPFSYYLVWKRVAQNNEIILHDGGSTYAYLQYVSNWYVGDVAASSPLANNTVVIKSVRSNNVDEALRATDGVDAAGTPMGGSTAQSRALGVSNSYAAGFDGTVYEFLVYNERLSDVNNTAVIDYLKAKWGIA